MSHVGIVLSSKELCKFIGIDFTHQSVINFYDKHNFYIDKKNFKYMDLSIWIYDDLVPALNDNIKKYVGIDTNEFQFYTISIDEWKVFFGFEVEHNSTPEEVFDKIARFKKATHKECVFYNICTYR
jgi:hypothetical protein